MPEWKTTTVDLSTNITTILAVPTLVHGAYVTSIVSAHNVMIKDGTTHKHTIPASATVGNAYAFGPARYETSLIVDPDDAGTGKITLTYRDLARND